ncbi:MAG: thiamine-phosphate kinase [Bacteroidota bacterium]
MADEKRTEIGTLGEFGLIDELLKKNQKRNASSVLGPGDDAALISHPDQVTVVSTDAYMEKIHFDLMYFPLKHLGYKVVVASISDIYAMNAKPKQITVALAISNRFSVEALEELYEGIYAACKVYNVDLIGGDITSSASGLAITVTAIGAGDSKKIVKRSGAKPGDVLCVSGDLGSAFLGLQILEREKQLYLSNPGIQPDLEDQDYVIGRQLKPEARKDIIEYFEQNQLVPTSMIDISDGLASEVFHIAKSSDVGVIVEEGNVPIKQEAELLAIKFKLDPITCALSGGEDYELLFTIDPGDFDKIQYATDIKIIGEIVDKADGVKLHTSGGNIKDLTAQGWKHF